MIGRRSLKGGVAPLFLVDEEFADAVSGRVWFRIGRDYLGAVVGGRIVKLHRFVWALKHGSVPAMLDHINGVRWDNRIANLRPATPSLNSLNAGGSPSKRSGLPKGVRAVKSGSLPFEARISVGGRRRTLGSFATPEEASAAYEAARSQEIALLSKAIV